ncbi:MAG: signal peptide peptidase SppA [Bacteroidia bacterium]|nr:signal peptide peptidase SppA [Bacteroidia bacterium]
MKSFFKIVFATILGMFLTFFLMLIILGIAISASGGKKEVIVKENSILHITLNEALQDRPSEKVFENFSIGNLNKPLSLREVIENIEKASADDDVSGIFLDLSTVKAGMAAIEEVRNALLDFKKSGKFIIAYGEVLSQSEYYLATVADKIYVHPTGLAELKGLRSEILFFKGTLDKLGLEPQVFRHGKFKSAVEPFIQDKLSDANREQVRTFLNSFWNHILEGIAKERKMQMSELQQIASNLQVTNAADAKQMKLVDELKYRDEVLEELKTKTEAEAIDKIHFVSMERYRDVKSKKERGTDKIAVVYAEGDIVDGNGDEDEVGSVEFSKAIRKARLDERVKAVVLRVNSPGGSALASETIWREVALTKKAKPVIVSMGNLAASGGYYISCDADTIVAQPNTITGSIGVFGLFFNYRNLMNKIGVSVDTVKTAKYADVMSPTRVVTAPESLVIQREIERIYDTFITRVANGRKLSKAQVDSIGQGRVWSGEDAKRIGLVDVLGGLDTAIAIAARKAKLDKYRITELPFQEGTLEKMIKKLSGETEDEVTERVLGDSYYYYQQFEKLKKMQSYQARLPYNIRLN